MLEYEDADMIKYEEELSLYYRKCCYRCQRKGKISNYYINSDRTDCLSVECKDCIDYRFISLFDNKDKFLKRLNNPFYIVSKEIIQSKRTPEQIRDNYLLINYGITLQEYNNIYSKQKGCCYVCDNSQLELKKSLAVDHDHKTGKVRGLLCQFCNTALGLFKEDVKILERAIEYLKR